MEGDLRWCCGSSSNDWDLHAVVRLASCSGGSRVTSPWASDESFSCLPLPPPQSQKDEVTDAEALQQLPIGPAVDDLCLQQAFFATPKPRNEAPPQEPPAKPRTSYRNNGVVGGPTRSKRKKKSQVSNKEVKRVPVGTSPDNWAWRKYGQKPLKGSPYPRGYYRCSTDKDCRARKQVERCRNDPSTLIVSYTGEHRHPVPLHRSSLAGTTRNKTQPTSSSTYPAEQPPAASPIDTTTTPLLCLSAGVGCEEEEEDNNILASMPLEDTEMQGEDEVLLFLNPVPSPSNGSGSMDVMLFPEPHRPVPGTDNGGSEKVMPLSKLHELPLPVAATTSSSRTGDGPGAAPAAMNVTDDKCPFAVGGCSAGGGDQLG